MSYANAVWNRFPTAPIMVLLFFVSTMVQPSFGYAVQHWILPVSVEGAEIKCAGTKTKDRLIEVLRKAGLPEEVKYPAIDWSTQIATVVAPTKFYEDNNMKFYGFFRRKNHLVLSYGWKKVNREPKIKVHKDGSQSMSIGSHAPEPRVALVVAYSKTTDKGRGLLCSRRR